MAGFAGAARGERAATRERSASAPSTDSLFLPLGVFGGGPARSELEIIHPDGCRFADHLPYFRLEDITGRHGYRIDRSTQWRWMHGVGQGVTRLTDLMWNRARKSTVPNVDETYIKELAGEGRTLTG